MASLQSMRCLRSTKLDSHTSSLRQNNRTHSSAIHAIQRPLFQTQSHPSSQHSSKSFIHRCFSSLHHNNNSHNHHHSSSSSSSSASSSSSSHPYVPVVVGVISSGLISSFFANSFSSDEQTDGDSANSHSNNNNTSASINTNTLNVALAEPSTSSKPVDFDFFSDNDSTSSPSPSPSSTSSPSSSSSSASSSKPSSPYSSPSNPYLPTPSSSPALAPSSSPPSSSSSALVPPPVAPPPRRLSNPGKFDNVHRESLSVLSVQNFQGAKFTFGHQTVLKQSEELHTDPNVPPPPPLKQFTVVPVLSYGDPNTGTNLMLQMITQLHTTHQLVAVIDSNFNVQGKYKYSPPKSKLQFKFDFQAVPQNEMVSTSIDYKGDTETYQLQQLNIISEISGSAMFAITPSLSLGVQVQTALGAGTFVNFAGRYFPLDSNNVVSSIYAASYKTGLYQASYHHRVDPTCFIASSFDYNSHNHESVARVGVHHRRQQFQYFGGISSLGEVAASLETQIAQQVAFGVNGKISHDGSNESLFGFNLSVG